MSDAKGVLEELVAALKENTEELRFLTSVARAGGANKAPAPEAKSKPAADKAPTEKSTRTRKPKAPTAAEVSAATKEFLNVDDNAEYNERKDLVKRIVKHYDVSKMSEIAEESRAEALAMLEAHRAGDDPFENIGSEEGEEDLA